MPWRAKVSGESVSDLSWKDAYGSNRRTLEDFEVLNVQIFRVDVELDLGHGHVHWRELASYRRWKWNGRVLNILS